MNCLCLIYNLDILYIIHLILWDHLIYTSYTYIIQMVLSLFLFILQINVFFSTKYRTYGVMPKQLRRIPGDCVRAWGGGDASSWRMSWASFASLPCLPALFSFLFLPEETSRKSTIRLLLPRRNSLFPFFPLAEVRQIK